MKHTPFFTVLVLIALLTGAVTSTAQEDAPARSGLRPDAPTYAIRGPHPVGTMEMVLPNEERPAPVTIWYPALNQEGLAEEHTYPVVYPPVLPAMEAYGKALFEAEPDTQNGPYPLAIWSHGFSNIRMGNTVFVEHLASWGFVVIAPDHLDMTVSTMMNEPATFYTMYYTTPRDVSSAIDFAEDINADGIMSGMIDMENIAASGHSSGGFTALQAGGGQLDLAGLIANCEALEGASFDCPIAVPNSDELAALYGLNEVPSGLLPSLGDNRIDALVPLAGDQLFFGETGLNAVTVPTLYMVGTYDQFVPIEDSRNGFATLGSDVAYMAEFDYAGHGLFQDTCERFPTMAEFGFYDLCAEKVWDKLRAHDLINHYGTAFLLWQLKDDQDAAAVFAEDAETFPGVEVIEN